MFTDHISQWDTPKGVSFFELKFNFTLNGHQLFKFFQNGYIFAVYGCGKKFSLEQDSGQRSEINFPPTKLDLKNQKTHPSVCPSVHQSINFWRMFWMYISRLLKLGSTSILWFFPSQAGRHLFVSLPNLLGYICQKQVLFFQWNFVFYIDGSSVGKKGKKPKWIFGRCTDWGIQLNMYLNILIRVQPQILTFFFVLPINFY